MEIDGKSKPTPPIEEPDDAYPPRYRWLKRGVVFAIAVLVLIVAIRVWWGYEAQRRLDAAIAAIRGRGEPILLEDFQTEPIPDQENSAFFLQKAIASFQATPESPTNSSQEWLPDQPPYPDWVYTMAERAEKANRAALTQVREARKRNRADWNIPLRTPAFSITLPSLSSLREMANVLGDAALAANHRGDDRTALEYIQDIFCLSDSLHGQPFLVSHLVAIGIQAIALDRLQLVSTSMRVQSDSTASTTMPAQSASRPQAEAMIRRLLDEEAFRQNLEFVFKGERMGQLDWMLTTVAPRAKLLRPMLDLDALNLLQWNEMLIRATHQPNWPAAKASGLPATISWQQASISRKMSAILGPATARATETHFRIIGERRMIAVVMAMRLYALDHGGTFPAALEELVPDYLPYIPRDPLASDDQPLKYLLAENGARPIVYSVGENGVDDTAAGASPSVSAQYGWQNQALDQWRDATRWSPPASLAPLTEEIEHGER